MIAVTQRGLVWLGFTPRPEQPHIQDAGETTLIQRGEDDFWATAEGGADDQCAFGPTPELAVHRAFERA